MNARTSHGIATTPVPNCYLCGDPGVLLYDHLQDRLFGVPGSWNFKRCPNPDCNLVWLDPMPTLEDIGKAYETYYTHTSADPKPCGRFRNLLRSAARFIASGYLDGRYGYASARHPGQKAMGLLLFLLPQRRLSADRQVLGLKARKGGRLLDIGCGNGALLARLQNLGWQVEGIDVDAAAVAQARLKGVSVRCGILEDQHYPENHFDVINLNHVIEHLHDPLSILRECHRILNPRGVLSIVTPNINSLGHKKFHKWWRGLEPPRHLYVFCPSSLQTMVCRAGFILKTLTTSPLGAYYIAKESHSISSTDVYRGKFKPRIIDRLSFSAFFWQEKALLKFSPGLGEELVLLGEK
jgi:2-polyprenyl-3-methyl-5-hydroxy-6-metoxy-1,4-benzoquinol methylase